MGLNPGKYSGIASSNTAFKALPTLQLTATRGKNPRLHLPSFFSGPIWPPLNLNANNFFNIDGNATKPGDFS